MDWTLIQKLRGQWWKSYWMSCQSPQTDFFRMTHRRLQVAHGQNMQMHSSQHIRGEKCWFYRRNVVPKTSAGSCENVLHKQACLLPPLIAAQQERFWRLLNSSVVFCLARRTHNYQTKGRTHHSLCTKALFNTNSLLKFHSAAASLVSARVQVTVLFRWPPRGFIARHLQRHPQALQQQGEHGQAQTERQAATRGQTWGNGTWKQIPRHARWTSCIMEGPEREK